MTENLQPTPQPAAPLPPIYPAPKKRSLWWLWTLIALGVCCLLVLPIIFFVAIMGSAFGNTKSFTDGRDGVALIRIEGIITAGQATGGLFSEGAAGSETIVENIQRALDDDKVKAILLRINSPGGSPAGAQEVYNELIKAQGEKPIVVSMGDVAASGGYYIAAAADKIYCNPGTMTGSIGVINSHTDFSELFKKLGVKYETITTGEFKDMGVFSRPYTANEKTLISNMLGDIYDQFVSDVATGRKLPKADVKKIADGRVFTGRQALKVKLVDELGGLQEALDEAGKMGGLHGKIRKIEYGPSSFLEYLMGVDNQTKMMDKLSRQMLLNELAKQLSAESLKQY